MKYLRKFDTVSEMNTVLDNSIIDIIALAYNGSIPVLGIAKPKKTPFYIDVRGAVTLAATSGLQMSTDGETWTDTTATTLSSGKTYFRVASDQSSPLKPNWTEDSNSDYDIGGNINSLVKVNFANDTTCYSFYASSTGFFQGKAKLKSAGKLILPATTLINGCYTNMFRGCSSLTTAPALPATTLTQSCYQSMFNGCTSLTTAPALPATTLATQCYAGMFVNCTALTSAPELPATTLANLCYTSMFIGCSSLTTAPAILSATTLTQYCYCGMFADCTSLTTAPELPATTLTERCYESMFQGCTSLTTAPVLPATTLAERCYYQMFKGCTSLTTAPELPATTLANNCYYQMFLNSSNLNYIKCLATNISASNCTADWTNGVSATGTFVKDASMSSWITGNNGIPSGWSVEDATE